jgi:hypothetical protein
MTVFWAKFGGVQNLQKAGAMDVKKTPAPFSWKENSRLGRVALGLELSFTFFLRLLLCREIISTYFHHLTTYLMCYVVGFCIISASTTGLVVILPFILLGPIGGAVLLSMLLPTVCIVLLLSVVGVLPNFLSFSIGQGVLLPFVPLPSICWFLTSIFAPMGAVKFLNIGLSVYLSDGGDDEKKKAVRGSEEGSKRRAEILSIPFAAGHSAASNLVHRYI